MRPNCRGCRGQRLRYQFYSVDSTTRQLRRLETPCSHDWHGDTKWHTVAPTTELTWDKYANIGYLRLHEALVYCPPTILPFHPTDRAITATTIAMVQPDCPHPVRLALAHRTRVATQRNATIFLWSFKQLIGCKSPRNMFKSFLSVP